jgi:cytochrome bd-type quinol oxidase subunit 2
MKIPTWLVLVMHIVRGFAIGFGPAIAAADLSQKLTWILAIGGGVIGAANSVDALRTEYDPPNVATPNTPEKP